MTDKQIISEIKEYFCIEEFVSKPVFDKYGEKAWQFLSIRMLHTMLIIRKELGLSITINNWKWGGKFSQRGLRENTSQIVMGKNRLGKIYLSAHVLGRAVDFDVKGMEAYKVRLWLKDNYDKLPYSIRLENEMNGKQISWVHLDTYSNINNPKVYLFNV
tara:strand:+ start:274 stop:750 length:477 start_codon:yes stop_codon:yes gene_type:complete